MAVSIQATRWLAGLVVSLSASIPATEAVAAEGDIPGVFTEEQAERGRAAYRQACAECHLDDLSGAGIPALVGEPFHVRWNGLSLGDLVDATRTTMPEEAPGSLSRQAYVDIVGYLLQVNGFPAGETELPTEATKLRSIIIREVPQQ